MIREVISYKRRLDSNASFARFIAGDAGFLSLIQSWDGPAPVLFYPAFDDAFVDDARLKQLDGLHPTAAGIEAVVTRMLPTVEALIDRARRKDR